MEWEFRKVLESFQTYKKVHEFRNQIQRGESNVLRMTTRQIQMILSQPKQKIKSKVLALRFLRDIMVLGRQDVAESVQKLVPDLLKICSYQLESDDPNRGQTIFHQHPSYLKAKQQQRRQIDQFGSTYLILSLQSILHWGKWIPLDVSGKISIYAKAYNDLLQRGVIFPKTFHYYKQSDTQKFKNTYKVEFFTDSYYTSHAQLSNSSASVVTNQNCRPENQISVQNQIFEKTSITTISQIREHTQQLFREYTQKPLSCKQSNSSVKIRLQSIKKRLQQIYQQQFSENKLSKSKQLKQLKSWTDRYLINYGFYCNKRVDLNEFLTKINAYQIQLENPQEQSINVSENPQRAKIDKSPKKQVLKASCSSQQLLRKQQYQHKVKMYQLKNQIDQSKSEVQNLISMHKRQKRELIEDYEGRMQCLKVDLAFGSKGKDRPLVLQLEVQNQQLKKRVHLLQLQLSNVHSLLNVHSDKQHQLQKEQYRLQVQVKKLKIQNQKLILIINEKNEKQYKAKLQTDSHTSKQNNGVFIQTAGKMYNQSQTAGRMYNQNQIYNQSQTAGKRYNQNQTTGKKSNHELESSINEKNDQINKLEKAIRKTQDQLALFKTELNSQRSKKDLKTGVYMKKVQYFQNQNKTLKQKLHEAKKTIDVKDVQIMDLKEDLRRYQNKLQDMNEKKGGVWSETPSMGSERYRNNLSADRATSLKKDAQYQLISNKKIRFNNYEDLYLQLKPVSKQSFLRLCRSAFKKKDILFKQNEFQIGVISQALPDNRVNFILHLTNVAQRQIENIRIEPLLAQGSYVSTLSYELSLQYIFCIQPQEQEKVQCIVGNNQAPYIKDRAVIRISYHKNGLPFTHNIFLPFMIPKFLVSTRPSRPPTNTRFLRQQLIIRYTKKMIPRPSYIKSYFQNFLQRIQQKTYQVQLYHRDTDLNIYLTFNFAQNQMLNIEAVVLRQKINQKQKYILEETLGFIQVAFRK